MPKRICVGTWFEIFKEDLINFIRNVRLYGSSVTQIL